MPSWRSSTCLMPSGSSAYWASDLHGMGLRSIPTHSARRFGHTGTGSGYILLQPIERSTYQDRVVYRGADLNALLSGVAAREPQHLGTICLHREIAQHARVRVRPRAQMPPEHGPKHAVQHRMVDGCI